MQTPVALQDAAQRHPTAVAEVVAELNRKLAKAKLAPVDANAATWSYSWFTHIGGPDDGAIGLSLTGTIGRRQAYARLGQLGKADAKPPEVETVLHPAAAITLTTPHVAVLEVSNPQTGQTTQHLVVAAYARKGATRLVVHEVGDIHSTPMLYTITPQGVCWAGGLRETAHKALMACPEGGTWTWRRMAFQRLDAAAIQALIPNRPVAFLGIERT
jgi:hypothetical protein